ncbi:MAG: AccI family restriction endonuclease [Verrucomicrobia bacterium]|nr:AccI family restriction endonuclease [Verrucomicrobiota bacterium]
MAGSDYFEKLKQAAGRVTQVLAGKGVAAGRLCFGGEGVPLSQKPRIPVDANSNFLGNRAMGDWAESVLKDLLLGSPSGFHPIHYGDSNQIAAGDAGFKDYYLGELEATRVFGKRPDLLLYPPGTALSGNEFKGMSVAETEAIAHEAIAAIEVRSSKFKALQYMRAREAEREAGAKVDRSCPSFTVKVEDLIIVYRWMERFQVPECYAQVFFDSIFGINFLQVFEIIGSGSGFTIEKPRQSQEKATIMIPITCGRHFASCSETPDFRTEIRETRLGRVDAFVSPVSGKFVLDPGALNEVLFPHAGTEIGR